MKATGLLGKWRAKEFFFTTKAGAGATKVSGKKTLCTARVLSISRMESVTYEAISRRTGKKALADGQSFFFGFLHRASRRLSLDPFHSIFLVVGSMGSA